MPDPTNDIDALLRMLNTEGWEHYHSAVTALVAERDALKRRVAELKDAHSQPTLSRCLQLEEALRHGQKEGGGA